MSFKKLHRKIILWNYQQTVTVSEVQIRLHRCAGSYGYSLIFIYLFLFFFFLLVCVTAWWNGQETFKSFYGETPFSIFLARKTWQHDEMVKKHSNLSKTRHRFLYFWHEKQSWIVPPGFLFPMRTANWTRNMGLNICKCFALLKAVLVYAWMKFWKGNKREYMC